jgi:hypothetical protein
MAIDEKTLEAVATALRDADGNAPAGYSWGQYADDARAAILAYEKAMAPTPETWNEKALSEGYRGKIDWIREYRARSNATLKDSKEAYERDAPMFVAAPPAAKPSGWQDISSVPQDGTIVLLDVGWVAAGCWAPDDCMDRYPWKFFDTDRGPIINGAEHATRHSPTRWQPLPAPSVGSQANLADATKETPL